MVGRFRNHSGLILEVSEKNIKNRHFWPQKITFSIITRHRKNLGTWKWYQLIEQDTLVRKTSPDLLNVDENPLQIKFEVLVSTWRSNGRFPPFGRHRWTCGSSALTVTEGGCEALFSGREVSTSKAQWGRQVIPGAPSSRIRFSIAKFSSLSSSIWTIICVAGTAKHCLTHCGNLLGPFWVDVEKFEKNVKKNHEKLRFSISENTFWRGSAVVLQGWN